MSSPVREQYLRLKAAHPDALLFFRLGDFYELFDRDAEIAARELQLTLTGRDFSRDERAPMAGVPYQHADGYIARLVDRGYRVAIAEQIGDPKSGKGLVERRIVRVITPGTVRDPTMLESARNNFLAAILLHEDAAGIAYADITTGELYVQQVAGRPVLPVLARELERIAPSECLWPFYARQPPLTGGPAWPDQDNADILVSGADLEPPLLVRNCAMTAVQARCFALEAAQTSLEQTFGAGILAGKAYAGFHLALGAVGALLAYLAHTQPASVPILRQPVLYRHTDHMSLDAPTRRNLELAQTMRAGAPAGSLLAVLDRTRTPMGGRLLRRWLNAPLVVLAPLLRRQAAVAALVDATQLRLRVIEALHGIGDIDRLVSRAQQGAATPRELLSLARTLDRLQGLRQALTGTAPVTLAVQPDLAPTGDTLDVCAAALDNCGDLCATIKSALVDEPPINFGDGDFIRTGYAEAIDAIDAGSKEAREWLAGLESAERRRTGIKSLKVVYSRVFGYAIEVSKSNLAQVPADYIRRQTVANGERYVTQELKQREAQILQAQEQRVRIEHEILQDLRRLVAEHADIMLRSADAVAQIDLYVAFATVALERSYCRPVLDEEDRIVIEAGRHPVVEVTQQEVAFVPNDTVLDSGRRLLVLTGPNMAGKSTYLRQVALIVLLAQVGSFVPATAAQIGLVDRIFTRVGAQDDLAAGQSTFMVEMVETSAILAECTPRSLVILDEIGRGTSTYDGLAIAQAVLEYIHDDPGHRAKTIFATHYHELTVLADTRPHVQNLRMEVLEDAGRVVFLRRVVQGGADRSYGIHVAELAGLPGGVVKRAQHLLKQLEAAAPSTRAMKRKMREGGAEFQLPLFGRD